ncbi:MAG: sensory histidine kinase in two-component regulatory system with ZraR [Verrucomicrobiota bacterium]|jgi:signal transduction histidine kinase
MIEQVGKWLKQLLRTLELPAPEVAHRLARIKSIERNLVLPLKVFAISVILFSFQKSPWFGLPLGSFDVTVNTLDTILGFYIVLNCLVSILLLRADHLPFALVQWSMFTMSLADGIFVGALTLVSGGYDSLLFWLFVVLIVRNVASNPPVWSQLVLNSCMALCFAVACILALNLNSQIAWELNRPAPPLPNPARTNRTTHVVATTHPTRAVPAPSEPDEPTLLPQTGEGTTEEIAIRVIVLLLGGVWLFVVQVLFEKQKLAQDEAREFSARENQLRSAGRLAAEFAHQIKNPLAIVTNAAYSLERGLKTGKGDPKQHLEIILEEVRRADGIITQVMGYAELSEGRVERLDLLTEVRRAIKQTFPAGMATELTVRTELRGPFPPMLMQRRHLSEILVNLLQNAREALAGKGAATLAAHVRPDLAVEISVTDNGPGIAPDKVGRIFEAYFTTKERGTGLGLAIVKNNAELYGGTVRVESELGKGARFILVFPAKASVNAGS